MTITLTPEHERKVQVQLASGNFYSVEEALDQVFAPLKAQGSSTAPTDETNKAQAAPPKAQAAPAQIRELRKGVTLDRPPGISLREYAHLGDKC